MMHALDYLNFDLLLEAVAHGYRARVIASPAGEAKEDFALPALTAATGVQAIGAALFATLFVGAVGDCLSRAWQKAQAEAKGLRLRLRIDPQAPALAVLPWETLYWAQQQRFLALSVHSPIVRYLEQPRVDPPLAVTAPLRVLVLIAAPADLLLLDSEHEWQLVHEATADLVTQGHLVLERLAQPTLSCLQDRLRPGDIHLLHFMGHGLFDEQRQQGCLFFENEAGNVHKVDATTLATLLHDKPPRLIFLNACQGATGGAQNVFAGVAQTLVQQGIPAVIAMSAPISDNAAKTLAHTFYKALAAGYPADAALTEARKALYAAAPTDTLAEWATPVLFSRAPDNRLFTMATANIVQPEPLMSAVPPKPRRIDAATPSRATIGDPIYLIVQVRFADSPLLGSKDFPGKTKPRPIERAQDTVRVDYPIDPKTGRLLSAVLKVAIVAPGFIVAGKNERLIEVPPDEFSKRIDFLLTPRSSGNLRINVELYNIENMQIGSIPLECDALPQVLASQELRQPGWYNVGNLILFISVSGAVHESTFSVGSGLAISPKIATGAGTYVAGDATVGGDLVGRDKMIQGDEVHGDKVAGDKITNIYFTVAERPVTPASPLLAAEIERQFFEPETVLIPAGPFWMGSDDGPEHERPRHQVILSAYHIGKYPVTNAQFAEYMRQSGRVVAPELGWTGQWPSVEQEQYAVSGVTWNEALAYCNWLSQITGHTYTLPNEAQWEKATRGVDGRIYPWGEAWETGRCNHQSATTAPVDQFPAQSIYGCYDLVGNGREWTASLWGERLTTPDPRYHYPWYDDSRNDLAAHDQIRRIWRGSAASDPQQQCRCTARGAQLPSSRGGPQTRFRFRVVMKV